MGLELEQSGKKATLSISGNFIRYETVGETERLLAHIYLSKPTHLILKNKGIGKWDSSLLVILYDLIKYLPKVKVDTSDLPDGLKRLLALAFSVNRHPNAPPKNKISFLEQLGDLGLKIKSCFDNSISFLKEVCSSFGRWGTGRAVSRPIDFWLALDNCGPKAVGIVTLISFMVGLILAFVGALQLKSFGAQIYVASLVTIAMTRIMGAIMVGIIMAGRTGASYAAAIGTMQVNEELDALKTMGISKMDFLVLPRLLALTLAMPFLTILADLMGIIGGGFVGILMLDISPEEYWRFSVDAFNLTNFYVGIFHGFIFGIVIALCGCYFGIKTGRNADSVGLSTTKAVVFSIVWMIVMTGIITLICEVMDI